MSNLLLLCAILFVKVTKVEKGEDDAKNEKGGKADNRVFAYMLSGWLWG